MNGGGLDTHHAALLRALPASDVTALARRNPTRLPDRYLQQEEAKLAEPSPGSESDSFGGSSSNTDGETTAHREFRYSYPEPDNASSSVSEGILEPPRYALRKEDDRQRGREVNFERWRKGKEGLHTFHAEDRSSKSWPSYEMSARDYIERSGGRTRQYQESARRPSPPRVSPKDKVEYIRRSEGRPAVMVRRGSGKPRPASREPEELPRRELPRRESPRRDRERNRRMSHDYSDLTRKAAPPLLSTKSAPEHIQIPDPRRAYSMQTEAAPEGYFQPPPVPAVRTTSYVYAPQGILDSPSERSSRTRLAAAREHSGTLGEITTNRPSSPEVPSKEAGDGRRHIDKLGQPLNDPWPYLYPVSPAPDGKAVPHATLSQQQRLDLVCDTVSKDDTSSEEAKTLSFLKTAMMPHMMKLEPRSLASRLHVSPLPETRRSERARIGVEQPLYEEIPISSRVRQSSPSAEPHYQQYRPSDIKYQTGYSSRRGASTRPTYRRGNSYTSQAAY